MSDIAGLCLREVAGFGRRRKSRHAKSPTIRGPRCRRRAPPRPPARAPLHRLARRTDGSGPRHPRPDADAQSGAARTGLSAEIAGAIRPFDCATTTVLITEHEDRSYVSCAHTGAWDRLVARLRAWTLDTALANGASPDSSPLLSLRAQKLIGRATRRRLSREVWHLLRQAERPPDPLMAGSRIRRDAVIRSRAELEELANLLLSSVPVDARGVARVRLLLRDGASPLYHSRRAGNLERAVEVALDRLRLRLSVDV